VHGHRGLVDGATRRTPAVVDAAEVGELLDPEASRHVDLVVGLDGEQHHSVDLPGLEPRIPDRRLAALDGQAQRAAARILGELGRADASDGGLAGEGHRHRFAPPLGSSSVIVPVT
jgi:hypothetical protein